MTIEVDYARRGIRERIRMRKLVETYQFTNIYR